MIGNRKRVRSSRRVWPGRVGRPASVALLVAFSVAAAAQSPPRLDVYSGAFAPSSTSAPSSAQRGASILVDVAVLEQLEADTTALEARMAAHVADTGAHQPHGHSHNHGCPPGYTGGGVVWVDPGPADDVEGLADGAGSVPDDPCLALVLLREAIDLLAPAAHAQSPLTLYREDLGGPGATAPASTNPTMAATLTTDIPLIDQVRALITQLDTAITNHVAARPGHAHSHPHTH